MAATNPGQYDVKRIVEFGLIESNGKESAFIKFDTTGGEFTWYGSLNPKVNEGKKMSGRDVALQTMIKLGWNGDTDAFANAMPCFTLPEGVKLEVGDEIYNGQVKENKVLKVLVPGFGGGKMDQGKAKSLLAGMKADIAKSQQTVAMQKTDPDF